MSRNIDIIYLVVALFIYNIKTLVTYQVTNDHGLSCLHKLYPSIVQTRVVNVRTAQKSFHNQNRTTLTHRTSWMDQDTTALSNVFRWIQFPPLAFRWTCSIQRHHTVPSLLHYLKALTIICIVLIYWLYSQIILNNTYR